MSTKRPASDAGGSDGPPAKKSFTRIEPLNLGSIYSLEQMDMKVLQFQNKKLVERIDQRKRAEEELHKRIEQLENRQRTDDAVLMIVNRYWNQLDEDVRVLVQRFDAETADEDENKNQSTETTSFLALLSTWDRQELEQRLGQRVEFSKRVIGKLLQAFDRLLQRNEKLNNALRDKVDQEEEMGSELVSSDIAAIPEISPMKSEADIKKEPKEPEETTAASSEVKTETEENKPSEESTEGTEVKTEPTTGGTTEEVKEVKKEGEQPVEVKTEVKVEPMETAEVKVEEKPSSPLSVRAMKDELQELQTENKRLHNMVTDLHQRHHENTLKVAELQDKLTAAETEIAELKNQSEDLEYNYQVSSQRAEKLDRYLSDAFQKLQTYEDKNVIQLEGGKSVTGVSKNKFDEIISDLEEQKDLASNRLAELEKLQKDHQKALKDIEQLKLDLQHLPESVIVETTEYKCLQSQFSVLYNESLQMKTQLDESRTLVLTNKNAHLRQIEQMESDELMNQKKLRTEVIQLEDALGQVRKAYEMLRIEFEQTLAAHEQTGSINQEMRNLIQSLQKQSMQVKAEAQRNRRKVKECQAEINKRAVRKSQDNQKELKLLLDMYKSAPKEQRDKVQLMACEKRLNKEIDDLRQHIKKMQETERKERKKLAEEDALRKIKKLEETITELQKNLATQKQREDVLLNEMDATGQAFEDMQEQNTRLLQQLREKDDANFKLMSERIKANQIQKLLREEKEVLAEQVSTIHTQVEAQILVVRKLEEKERVLQNNIMTMEKELALTQQALELHKRKAVESAQTAADLKLHLDKYQAQLREAQVAVAEKTGAIEQEAYKYKRMQEEIAKLQRKVERSKKIEMAGGADEVLLAEIQEYKEQLTCPSCKVNRKDAVLTKCFHVFCLECLKTRYETRQRKCPKCNAGFGANDYHRLYLT
ncbi:E3 ubiquitin-protein ligase Bre1-like [Ruditapes philippinarum]|uniref:E3 ubiquitin-protein ligase Bre1-like n=1 Tax=Ruditapes philippinarum TaxID=129788 RepID=UPI00295BE65F|nr:E3 ubiquitin-protein ligase Bre1-like [Ruditapes philippinarum]